MLKGSGHEELSSGQEIAADIYFEDARSIFRDMPRLAERLQGGGGRGFANWKLFIQIPDSTHPQDDSPPLLMTFYLVIP